MQLITLKTLNQSQTILEYMHYIFQIDQEYERVEYRIVEAGYFERDEGYYIKQE